mmetsp:Transcript_36386/g.90773  ORF Transcript_36386/g.90773 Transcript_36386/m.90773 type:complete len:256 (+) Transcript_36386:118-885(+)|eukprot:CAMPEP_0179873672 /NCGR_PEP_ID=MMETSP0982-20121206/22357_1 /TAXON_ID=483367 /ORGANISM="non described non described, Strain CCMP 2436" /LENGTH=255 /DNA_ID=CAMNT_0021765171 /DNA_START=93 /DNA_END=860 /DNA_ORIENTATION=-
MVARELLRVAVAQICQGAGFARAQEAACELLVDVLLKYIETVGLVARDSAESAGRTEMNFVDVHAALAELETTVSSLTEFARDAEDTPCARAVPTFPVKRKRILITPDDERADAEPPEAPEVPDWFPPFPDKAMYQRTPVFPPRPVDSAEARVRVSKHRRDAESAVVAIARAVDAPDGGGEVFYAGACARAPQTYPGATPTDGSVADALSLGGALPAVRLPATYAEAREAPRELLDAMRDADKKKKAQGAAADDE